VRCWYTHWDKSAHLKLLLNSTSFALFVVQLEVAVGANQDRLVQLNDEFRPRFGVSADLEVLLLGVRVVELKSRRTSRIPASTACPTFVRDGLRLLVTTKLGDRPGRVLPLAVRVFYITHSRLLYTDRLLHCSGSRIRTYDGFPRAVNSRVHCLYAIPEKNRTVRCRSTTELPSHGSDSGTRTQDFAVNSRALYQLS